jgi:hypothetical protein
VAETYYIGAYWGPRQESAEECAQRAVVFLDAMAQVDPMFARWFKLARSRKQSLERPLEPDMAGLRKFIQSKVLRSDDGVPMEGAGFDLALWNGGSGGNDVRLHLSCGSDLKWLMNASLVEPASDGSRAEQALTSSVMTEVLRAMARAWDPDWGVAMSHAHQELTEERGKVDVLVGWVTYLSRRLGAVPPLPMPVRVELVEEQGALIILTPERFTASNPEHIALADHARDLLERAGALPVW